VNLADYVRPVVGLEDRFLICRDGTVISKPKNRHKAQVRKLWRNKFGYAFCTYRAGKKVKKFSVHRAVAIAFLPNPDDLPFVNHLDHNPRNNDVDNLEWASPKDNVQHAIKAGRFVFWGEKMAAQMEEAYG
jgi:hypothetical protein